MHFFDKDVDSVLQKQGADTPLQPHQQRVVNRLQNSNHGLVAFHSTGSGKALHVDTPILTPTGWVRNGDIKVGDMVISQDGFPTCVTGVFPQGSKKCFKLTFSDGACVIADAEHLWVTQTVVERNRVGRRITKKRPSKRPTLCAYKPDNSVRTTQEIADSVTYKTYRYNHSIPMVEPVNFNHDTLPLHPYLLGVLIGDGCFSKSSPALTTMDIEIENNVRAIVAATLQNTTIKLSAKTKKNKAWNIAFPQIVKKVKKHANGLTVPARSEISQIIDNLGLARKRAWEKHIPTQYLFASVTDRIALLQGLMDTDGTCSSNGHTIDFCTTSPQLAKDVTTLVQSFGGMTTVSEKTKYYTYKGERRKGRLAYLVYIKLPNIFTPFKLSRKIERYIPKTRYIPTRYIASVEPIGKQVVQCISVEHPSQLYVINDFIVTHNTRLSVEAAKALGMPTDVTPPAALQENYKKELKRWDPKHTIKDLNILSQQKLSTRGSTNNGNGRFTIVDEAAKARDPKSLLHRQLAKSKSKKLLMTAAGIYNHPADLTSLINLAANKHILPDDRAEFEKQFVGDEEVSPNFLQRLAGLKSGVKPVLKPTPELEDALKKYVDYYDAGSTNKDFPSVKEEDKIVNMSKNQTDIYNTIMGKAPLWVRMKVKAGLPPSKKELASLRAFMTGPRMASNSTSGFNALAPAESSKAEAAFKYLQENVAKNPKYKGVVYSNYLKNGLGDYKRLLEANHMPYGEFSGDIPDAERQKHIRDFNNDKLKALLISSAGAEGLDLKGTRLVQLLEPHWNEEKEKQIIGRAKRYKSHEGLPEADRNVTVQRYIARPQGSFLDRIMAGGDVKGVDEYLRTMAQQKTDLNNQMIETLKNQQNPSLFRRMFKQGGALDSIGSALGSELGSELGRTTADRALGTVGSNLAGKAAGRGAQNFVTGGTMGDTARSLSGDALNEARSAVTTKTPGTVVGAATSGLEGGLASAAGNMAKNVAKGGLTGALSAGVQQGANNLLGISANGGRGGYWSQVGNRLANMGTAAGSGALVGSVVPGVGTATGAAGALTGTVGKNVYDAGVEGFGAAKDSWNTRDSALKAQADANRGPLSKPQSQWKTPAPAPVQSSAPMVSYPGSLPNTKTAPVQSSAPMVSYPGSLPNTKTATVRGALALKSPIKPVGDPSAIKAVADSSEVKPAIKPAITPTVATPKPTPPPPVAAPQSTVATTQTSQPSVTPPTAPQATTQQQTRGSLLRQRIIGGYTGAQQTPQMKTPEMTNQMQNQITDAKPPSVFNPNVIATPLGNIDKSEMGDLPRNILPDAIGTGAATWKLPGENNTIQAVPSERGFGAALQFHRRF